MKAMKRMKKKTFMRFMVNPGISLRLMPGHAIF